MENGMIGISKTLARAKKTMGDDELKILMLALLKIDWTKGGNSNEIELSKIEVADALGLKTDRKHRSQKLKSITADMMKNSFIQFSDVDGSWENTFLVNKVSCSARGMMKIRLDEDLMPLLENLDRDYITLWFNDVRKLDKRSAALYEHLRLCSDTRITCKRIMDTKELMDLFDVSEDDYRHTVKGVDRFNRYQFEKKVIDPAFNALTNCCHVHVVRQDDGKPYRKIKDSGYVKGYEVTYVINMHPNVITSDQLQEVREDPQVLKVASDLLKGKKSPRKGTQKPQNNINRRDDVNYEDLIMRQLTKGLTDC